MAVFPAGIGAHRTNRTSWRAQGGPETGVGRPRSVAPRPSRGPAPRTDLRIRHEVPHLGQIFAFATGPGRVAERIEAAKEVVVFRQDYRACWRRYRAGERDIIWPYGTYLMRARHGMRVADPP